MQMIEFATLDDWLNARDECICASDVPKLWGIYGSPLSLYVQKMRRERKEQTDAMRWGQLDQANILLMAREKLGINTIEFPPFTSVRREIEGVPFIATPDAFTDPEHELVECKSFSRMSDEAMDSARLQVQAQMMICDKPIAHLLVRHANRPLYHEVIEADASVQREIVERSAALWRCIRLQVPPDPIGSEDDIDALKLIYPQTDDQMQVELASHIVEEYLRVKDAIDHLEQRKMSLEADIRAMLGPAKVGVAGDLIVSRNVSPRTSPLNVPVQYRQRLDEMSIPYRGGNPFNIDVIRVRSARPSTNKKGDTR
jgi:predicted phage-related endonuclease